MIFFDKQGWKLFVTFFLLTIIVIFYPNGSEYNLGVLCSFLLVSSLSLFGMFSKFDKLAFSVNKTFHIFHYFFFGLAPALQFKKNITFFGANEIDSEVYIELGICLGILQIIYFLVYFFFLNKTDFRFFVKKFNFKNLNYNYYSLLTILFIFSILFLYLISKDFSVILLKPHSGWQKINTKSGLIGYTLFLVARGVPLIVFLLFKFKNKNIFSYWDVLFLFFVFLLAFPTSLPRATMASYYLPIVLVYFPSFFKKHIYVLSFLFLFFLTFPIFNFFRSFRIEDVVLGFSLFETAHMDAFHNFAQLYSQNIITDGRQLIGSIFFFVQESQWVNRPVGSGQMLAEMHGYSYTNISMPIWGEGFVNFGFLGMFFFGVIIAIINSFFDLYYKFNQNSIGLILFLFVLIFEFYLLRGDLFSSCKKIFSFVVAIILVMTILKLINYINKYIN